MFTIKLLSLVFLGFFTWFCIKNAIESFINLILFLKNKGEA